MIRTARILISGLLHTLAARIDVSEPVEITLELPGCVFTSSTSSYPTAMTPELDQLMGWPVITYKPTSYD